MILDEARKIFRAGGLVSATIVPAAMEKGWCVVFTPRMGDDVLMMTSRGSIRWFTSIDTAYGIIERIGFCTAKIRTFPPQHEEKTSSGAKVRKFPK